MDRAGIFHRLPHLDDSRLAEIFAHEVLRLLVGKGLLSPEWAERILSWRHTGFNVHSRVRARTKADRRPGVGDERLQRRRGLGPITPATGFQVMTRARFLMGLP